MVVVWMRKCFGVSHRSPPLGDDVALNDDQRAVVTGVLINIIGGCSPHRRSTIMQFACAIRRDQPAIDASDGFTFLE
jgi:hypothetical protein